jgi:hypothetical protein
MTALLKLCGRTLGWDWLPTLTATVLCVALAGCTRNNNLNVRGDGFEDNSMGETVRAGQLLFTLYSPMLESVQQEYLDALKIGNRDLIDASGDRLRSVGRLTLHQP